MVDEMEKLDLTWLINLEGKIKECEENIKTLEMDEKECIRKIAEAKNTRKNIADEKLPHLEEEERKAKEVIESGYEASWVTDKGEPRFIKELQNRKSAKEIITNFSSQVERSRSQTAKKKDELELGKSGV